MASATSSWTSHKFSILIIFLSRYRYLISSNNPYQKPYNDLPFHKVGYMASMHQAAGLKLFTPTSANNGTNGTAGKVNGEEEAEKVQPPVPPFPRPSYTMWIKWVLGSISVLVFTTQRMKKLLMFEEKIEEVVEEVESVAEVVEKVATTTEKVAAEVADKLPANCKVKEAALFIENVSYEAAKDAKLTEDFIHKVDELQQDFNDLEKMVEPVIDRTYGKRA